MIDDNKKPDMLKPVVWDRDSGAIFPVDQMDWRAEGTWANQRVEYLLAKSNLWGRITEVMIAITWAVLITTMFLDLIQKPNWMFWVSMAQWSLTVACYARSEGYRRSLKVWTEDE